MFPYGEPIVVTTRTQNGWDADGNPAYDETTVTVAGAFDPAIGFEQTNGQDRVQVQPTAYLPYGTVVDARSKLTIRGADYEVDGDPNQWRSPFTGWSPGVQVPLKKVTG